MSFLKNKHVITAMMVAPLLAVASYFMVDLVVQEPALEPVAGQAYHLIAKSNSALVVAIVTLRMVPSSRQFALKNTMSQSLRD